MIRLRDTIARVDFQRLAGVKRILGVDLADDVARIVELEKRGSLLNRHKSEFIPCQSFSCRFPNDATIEEKATRTATFIQSQGITTRYAVAAIHSERVRTTMVTIPTDISRLHEWIEENYEKLLRVPLPTGEVSYDYEVLGSSDTGTQVEITFVRNSDLDGYRSYFRKAGLHLLALGGGTRDAVNGIMFDDPRSLEGKFSLLYVNPPVCSVTLLNGGRREGGMSLAGTDGVADAIAQLKASRDYQDSAVCIAGSVENEPQASGPALAKPFGLPSEFTLATGLAIKGFLPELSPTNFLSHKEQEDNTAALYKSLTGRTGIWLGSVAILLLALQAVSSWLIESRMAGVQERFALLRPQLTALTALRRDIETLELNVAGSPGNRTATAKAIHDIAASTPDNVWLYRLQMSTGRDGDHEIALFGYSTTSDGITSFLKKLQAVCSEVRLVRSSEPLQSEDFIPASVGRVSFTTFEIRASRGN